MRQGNEEVAENAKEYSQDEGLPEHRSKGRGERKNGEKQGGTFEKARRAEPLVVILKVIISDCERETVRRLIDSEGCHVTDDASWTRSAHPMEEFSPTISTNRTNRL